MKTLLNEHHKTLEWFKSVYWIILYRICAHGANECYNFLQSLCTPLPGSYPMPISLCNGMPPFFQTECPLCPIPTN